jgi:hypothetical protein
MTMTYFAKLIEWLGLAKPDKKGPFEAPAPTPPADDVPVVPTIERN